jgi:transposase, IS30 family
VHSFHQLTLEERETLFAWNQQGISLREIGRRLGRSHTTISKELKRNRTGHGHRSNEYFSFSYVPCKAQAKALRRGTRQRHKAPLKGPLIFLYVREHLRPPFRWTPEEIAGRLPIDHPGATIDDETIYRYIYGRRQRRMKLWRYLVNHRRKRMRKHGRKVTDRGTIVEALPITKRPCSIAKRKQPGHWESDNLEGMRSDRTSVSVTVERRSRITRIGKLMNHRATTKTAVLCRQFAREPITMKRTLTVDNGPENKDGGRFQKTTGITRYKTTPYHSWEKGTVENTIGRLRRFIPKGMSVDLLTPNQLAIIETIVNTTPRKCLRFLTPLEVYGKIASASRKR